MSMTKPTAEQVTFKHNGLGAVTRTVQDRLDDTVNVRDFGAVGDGVTDDTAAIQAAIDWVMYRNRAHNAPVLKPSGGSVYLPAGQYRITDTLQLGYGTTFQSILMYGDGRKYRNETTYQFSGTAIFADFNDRPAIAVNSGRGTIIEKLTIRGRNSTWVVSQNLGNQTTPLVDDLVAANWVDPAFPASATSQYAPYAAIAIDPYSGPRPAVSYPDINYPSWLNYTTQYNKFASQQTCIRDVEIGGFVVGVVVQPCDYDGNGDYTRVLNCFIEHCQYGISVGQTQARDFAISDTIFSRVHTGIVTGEHGRKSGDPSFDVRNCSFLSTVWWADIPTLQFGGNVAFRNCYCELSWGIGLFQKLGGGNNPSGVTFDECDFNFDMWPVRGVPATIMLLGALVACSFNRCKFIAPVMPQTGQRPNVIHIGGDARNITISNCYVFHGFEQALLSLYEKVACNGTGGLVFVNCGTNLAAWSVRTTQRYNVNTGIKVNEIARLANMRDGGSRATGIPIYAQRALQGELGNWDDGIALPRMGGNSINKAVCASVSQSGRTVTLDVTGATTANTLFQTGGDVGDIVFDNTTSTVFIVAARTGLTLTLEAQNNLDASYNLIPTISLASGLLYTANCRAFAMNYVHYGDISSSSATISNVVRGDNASIQVNDANNGVQIDDAVSVGNGVGPGIASMANAYITNVTSNSIVLTGNARYTATRERLGLFIRKPTPNNT
jgi:hypothetical protein